MQTQTCDRWQLLIDLIVKLAETTSKPINQRWFMKAELSAPPETIDSSPVK